MKIALVLLLIIFAIITAGAFICFLAVFYAFKEKPKGEYDLPKGKEYIQYHTKIANWQNKTSQLLFEEFCITSYDGLKLYAKYYEYQKGAPIEIMFHGYKGNAKRDLAGGVQRCFALKRNAMLVDQRTAGKSEGRVITFGLRESMDLNLWVDFVIKHFGEKTKIILTGISMGAATVLNASCNKYPENVVGILADCGYTSTKEIIKKVTKDLKLPPRLLYPLIKLGALIFGGFNPDKISPVESVKKSNLPIIFFHGKADSFVPYQMSIDNYNACASPKKLVLTDGAAHGLCYPSDEAGYIQNLKEFSEKYWKI